MRTPTIDLLQQAGLRPGRWTLDPFHSNVVFSIRHLGLAKVRGRFDQVAATMDVGETVENSVVRASVDLASINTSNADRDAHLRSTDFFDTAIHPTMAFMSTAILPSDDGLTLMGDLTLNGITRPISLGVELNGGALFTPTGKWHAGFSASGAIKRSEFGIEFGLLPIGGDKLALGDEVKFEVDVEFVEPVVED